MEHDKVFNLQLTIQKLQEEVSLFRNGADGVELFQLIAEKECEIKALKSSNLCNNETLKKLAKKSAEVLARCDRVQSEYETLQFEHSDLIQERKRLAAQVEALKISSASSAALCQERKITIDQLEEELTARDASVEKLIERCAALVSQKNEKHKEFEAEAKEFASERSEKNKQMKELMEELERAMRFNAEAKERLSREQSNSFDLSNQLEKSQADLLTIVDITENLEVTNANNVAEAKRIAHDKFEVETRLNEVAALLVKANTRISALESHLNSSETERDTEINKLNQTIAALVERSAEERRLLEEEHNVKVTGTMNQLESAGRKLRKLEAEKALTVSNYKEADALRLKNSDLEEKIKRQDQYMKSRLLKDKTNIHSNALCAPVPSEPSHRPPSARALTLTTGTGTVTTASVVPHGDVRVIKAMR